MKVLLRLGPVFAVATIAGLLAGCGGGSEGATGQARVDALFDNASFVNNGQEVRIAGARVGTVQGIELTGDRAQVESTILDPLGSAFCLKEKSIPHVAEILLRRLERLREFGRVASENAGPAIEPPDEEAFYELVKEQAERFHAIRAALGMAQDGDAVVILGKGARDFQLVDSQKHWFHDATEARAALKVLPKRPKSIDMRVLPYRIVDWPAEINSYIE